MKYIPRFLSGLLLAALAGLPLYAFYPSHGLAEADRPFAMLGAVMSVMYAFVLGWWAMALDQDRMED